MADETTDGLRNGTGTTRVPGMQNLRTFLNSDRYSPAERRRAIEAYEHEMASIPNEYNDTQERIANLSQRNRQLNAAADRLRELERLGARRPQAYVDALLAEDHDTAASHASRLPPMVPSGLSPSNLVRTRRRAFRPSERLTRNMRERLTSTGDPIIPSPSYSTSPPHPSSPRPVSDSTIREYAESAYGRDTRTRSKRRKLDDGRYEDDSKAITYGHNGQVVPGQIKLEIASCDGGEYSDTHVPVNSWPQYVLQDDPTVYCTKSNRCNIIFKHASGMPFALTKMVIKAPRSGYDAPVHEGMIFVAMDDQSLLEKTAMYENHYSPKSYRYHRQRPPSRPSQDWSHPPRSPLRYIDRSQYLRDLAPPYHRADRNPMLDDDVISRDGYSVGEPSDDEDAQPRSSPPSPRSWRGVDPDYSFRSYADRYRPVYADEDRPPAGRYDYPSAPSSDSEAEESTLLEDLLRTRRRSRDRSNNSLTEQARRIAADEDGTDHRAPPSRTGPRSHRAIGAPDPMNPSSSSAAAVYEDPPPFDRHSSAEPTESSSVSKARDEAMREARRVAGEESATANDQTVLPHARFEIPRHRSSVAVRFRTPVAGRYVLIKLWASCPNANIDIQSITAHGYGGPRFFPGVEMR